MNHPKTGKTISKKDKLALAHGSAMSKDRGAHNHSFKMGWEACENNLGWIRFDKDDPQTYPRIYDKYEVYREGAKKQHYQTWNGSWWAYDGNDITHYREIISPNN